MHACVSCRNSLRKPGRVWRSRQAAASRAVRASSVRPVSGVPARGFRRSSDRWPASSGTRTIVCREQGLPGLDDPVFVRAGAGAELARPQPHGRDPWQAFVMPSA